MTSSSRSSTPVSSFSGELSITSSSTELSVTQFEGSPSDFVQELVKQPTTEDLQYAIGQDGEDRMYLCVIVKENGVSTITTTPAYGLSWHGHEQHLAQNGGNDKFLPVIHGNHLSANFQSGEARGVCVGPLNTNAHMCLSISGSASPFGTDFTLCPACSPK